MSHNDALQDFFADLRQQVGGDIRTDLVNRTLYSTDASLYQVMPFGVCFPRNRDEVQATVKLAAQHGIPILPRAGGTGLAGQTVNEAVVMDMSQHMNQVLEVNREEKWVRVQPGIVLSQLNQQLRPLGLQFGPDPASGNRAGIGGIVGNNATGSHSILYGMTADHVMETEVVLSDGSLAHFGICPSDKLPGYLQKEGLEGAIYRNVHQIVSEKADVIRAGTPRHWRRCGGYNLFRFVDDVPETPYPRRDENHFNLAQLITGSEGTLAVITECKLNLVPVPKMTALAIVHFDDAYSALDSAQVIVETKPSAVELLDHLSLTLARTQPAFANLLNSFVEGDPNSIMVTEYYGQSLSELEDKIARLTQHLQHHGVKFTAIVPLMTPAEQAKVWKVRKAGLGLLQSRRGDFKPIAFIEDTAVPVEHLADYITRLERFCHDLGTEMAYYAHASGGCLHVRPLVNTKDANELDKMEAISRQTLKLMHEYGGAFSSEHGDGRARSWLNEAFFGPELYELFREIKTTFDPHNLLNPGNIVNAKPISMREDLRFGAPYQPIQWVEKIDFSSDHGFHRAVEMCNGAGVCRKQSGTMCPSYMVTKEEEHSTRGRANMLRAALTGKIPADALTSERMYETMDLCISCKACKTECPSSVDMSKIKLEFLGHYHDKHGIPFRSRFFGNIHLLSRINSGPFAPLINRIVGFSPVKWLLERFMGISSQRTLPSFARQPFTRWFQTRQTTNSGDAHAQVVLFHDTFNTYNDPQIAIAATEVLEAAGFEVILPGHGCCGRPMISKGLIDDARKLATDTVQKLYPYAARGIPIVGLEPSCLLSLRDEYLYLLPNDNQVQTVAEQAYLFEEFIANLADKGQLKLQFNKQKQNILLHGHCHQKALVGTQPSKRTLTLAGYHVEEVDSGCCGMAGSFGYEAEHLDISLAMGERALFPAVRKEAHDTIIAAAGTSCREQILHGTGRHAKHPAQILRDALP